MGPDPDLAGLLAGQNACIPEVRRPTDVMSDAAAGGAAGLWAGGFAGGALEKEIRKSGIEYGETTHNASTTDLDNLFSRADERAFSRLVDHSPAGIHAGHSRHPSGRQYAGRLFHLASSGR